MVTLKGTVTYILLVDADMLLNNVQNGPRKNYPTAQERIIQYKISTVSKMLFIQCDPNYTPSSPDLRNKHVPSQVGM